MGEALQNQIFKYLNECAKIKQELKKKKSLA